MCNEQDDMSCIQLQCNDKLEGWLTATLSYDVYSATSYVQNVTTSCITHVYIGGR